MGQSNGVVAMDPNQSRRWGDGENVGSRLAVLEEQVRAMNETLESCVTQLVRLTSGRPSWAVATVVAILLATCTGLIGVIGVLVARGH